MRERKESGEITSEREEILRLCKDFSKSHHNQTNITLESTMKSSPDTEEIPQFIEGQVGSAIKETEKTQSPWKRWGNK